MKTVYYTAIGQTMCLLQQKVIFILLIGALFTSCASTQNWGSPLIVDTFTGNAIPPAKVFKDVNFTGTVTDREGNAMTEVAIYLDGASVAKTDNAGKFTISKNIDIAQTQTFTCKKDGYNNASATYHFQMATADFNLQMGKPCVCDSIIIDNLCGCLQNISFDYSGKITASIENQLDDIVSCMKTNPACTITIEFLFSEDKMTAPSKTNKLKTYLVNKGISESRIQTSYKATMDNSNSSVNIIVNR